MVKTATPTCNWRTLSVFTMRGIQLTVTVPTRNDIINLKVGDFVPNCFPTPRRVSSITARREDVNGRMFVCFYTDEGSNSWMSGSAKEDEMDFSVCWKVDSLHTEMEYLRQQVLAQLQVRS